MSEAPLATLTREELEAEVLRLRAALRSTEDRAVAPTGAIRRPSKARSRAVLESTTQFAIVVCDSEGLITDWNPGAEQVMGWTAQEMIGQDASRFFTPEDRANRRAEYEMAKALRDGSAIDERWHLRQDGQRFWASGEMMALNDDDDEPLGFVKILRDRTEEHLAGLALKETQERYRLVAEATNDRHLGLGLRLRGGALERGAAHGLVVTPPPRSNRPATGGWTGSTRTIAPVSRPPSTR